MWDASERVAGGRVDWVRAASGERLRGHGSEAAMREDVHVLSSRES